MCGIGGVFFAEKNITIDKDISKIFIENNSNRGPDHSEFWSNDHCLITHNRLSIVDLSDNGNQPMCFGDWVISFNGEIYNYIDLREILKTRGTLFYSNSDTEVVLHMIIEFGIEYTLKKINGMFAICAYDKKNNIGYLIKDRLGEKPLFYFIDENKNLYFSSTIPSIIKIFSKKWNINYDGLFEYFSLGGLFSENTLFKDIFRLDASSILIFNNGNVSKKYYWSPEYKYVEKDQDILFQIDKTIKSRFIGDTSFGLFLSGGVDSSTIASVVKNINFFHLNSKEYEFAKYIADKFKSKLELIDILNEDIVDFFIKFSKISGEPTMSGFAPFILSKAISKICKVGISGNAADELFFGYQRIPTPLISDDLFNRLTLSSKSNINKKSYNPGQQIISIFRHPENFSIPLASKYFKKINFDTVISPRLEFEVSKLSKDFSEGAKYRWIELMTYVKGDLNPTLDYSGMMNSLEVRSPFLDHELVSMALSVDERRHITLKNGRKHFLKEILIRNNISDNLWNRNKVGFSIEKNINFNIDSLKELAVENLKNEGFLELTCRSGFAARDESYLRSAALGVYFWKMTWVDSGIVTL